MLAVTQMDFSVSDTGRHNFPYVSSSSQHSLKRDKLLESIHHIYAGLDKVRPGTDVSISTDESKESTSFLC